MINIPLIQMKLIYFVRALFLPSLLASTTSVFLLGSSISITSNNSCGCEIKVFLHSLKSILSIFWDTKPRALILRVEAWYISPSTSNSIQFLMSIFVHSSNSQSSFNFRIWYWSAEANNSFVKRKGLKNSKLINVCEHCKF